MVTSSVLKGVTTYLSALNARSAVFNDDLTLIWTNCDEFFKTFDTTVISDALPIKSEQPVSVVVNKVKYAMNVVPLYRSKRLVSGYVCVLRDSYEVFRMVNSSAVSDFTELFLRETQEKASRIISINKVMEELVPKNEEGEKLASLMKEQYVQAMRLFTEATSTAALSGLIAVDDSPNLNCNISALVAGLCVEASQCLVKTKRKLIRNVDLRHYYARIGYKTFAVAFMSAFRSHLYISPLKSNIEVSSRFDDGDFFITVKSELLPEDAIDFAQQMRSCLDRELAHKIIASDCGGELTYTAEGGVAVTEMKVPVTKKNRGASLNSANSEYLTGGYRPVHPFMDEITEKEEIAIAAAKDSSGAPAKTLARKRRKK